MPASRPERFRGGSTRIWAGGTRSSQPGALASSSVAARLVVTNGEGRAGSTIGRGRQVQFEDPGRGPQPHCEGSIRCCERCGAASTPGSCETGRSRFVGTRTASLRANACAQHPGRSQARDRRLA